MLKIGLTGGIASGKSVAARRLAELGAVIVDADVLAREAVAAGTPGLRAVVEAFGPDVLLPDGGLDRPELGRRVFADPALRDALNGIVHPLVREQAAARIAAAPAGAVIVQDIPLLVETGQGAAFHLVVVVEADADERIGRMMRNRGMTDGEARARMAAQADDAERRAAADVVLRNDGTVGDLEAKVDELWQERLLPFAANLRARRTAARSGPAVLSGYDDEWPRAAARAAGRLARLGPLVLAVDHIGSTSVPGLAAKDTVDLQLSVRTMADADALADVLAEAGYPRVDGTWNDNPKPGLPEPADWAKRLHQNADPGRKTNLHVRAAGSAGWTYALAFRDWLRAEPPARKQYLELKHRLAREHARDGSTSGYAEAKEQWFTHTAWPELRAWMASSGWCPPSY